MHLIDDELQQVQCREKQQKETEQTETEVHNSRTSGAAAQSGSAKMGEPGKHTKPCLQSRSCCNVAIPWLPTTIMWVLSLLVVLQMLR